MTRIGRIRGWTVLQGLRRGKNYGEIAEFTCLSKTPNGSWKASPRPGIRHSLRVRFSADRRSGRCLSAVGQDKSNPARGSPPPERTLMKIYQVPPASRRPLREVRRHLEPERGGRDPGQVPRVREESPYLRQGDREALHLPQYGRLHPASPRPRLDPRWQPDRMRIEPECGKGHGGGFERHLRSFAVSSGSAPGSVA